MEGTSVARLVREDGLRLRVAVGEDARHTFSVDAAPPAGAGAGPSATELVAAAVGTCLSQSLLFCLDRSRTEVEDLETRVEASVSRNEQGRLRITGIRVEIAPVLATSPEDETRARARLDRCSQLFRDFCTVAESLEAGIPVDISIAEPVAGGAG